MVAKNVAEAVCLAAEIARLKVKPKSENPEQAEENKDTFEIETGQSEKVINQNVKLQAFFKLVNTQWNNIEHQNIGSVDWTPKTSMKNNHHYTQDIDTVELDAHKFKNHFMGNVVDLSAFCLIALINICLV